LNSRQVTEDGEPVQGNEVRFHISTPMENQLEDVKSPHAQDPTPQRDSGSISPQVRVPTPLRERGRDSPGRQANNKGSRIRTSERRRIPRRYFQIDDEVFLCTPLEVDEPTFFQEAVDSPNYKEWMDAMKDEMDSMARNKVWKLVNLPSQRKSIKNKWIFKIKRQADGSIDKFKARLVAKDIIQIEGIYYKETFSPVVRFASIRLLLTLVAHLDLELFQMDVKTAFLNENLEEEIYVDQPIGFVLKGQEDKVCRLKRFIYGLKQSSRSWYFRFPQAITSFGFAMVSEYHCVCVKRTTRGIMFLTLYVDDILLVGNNLEMINTTKQWLSSFFEMKNMGEVRYVLGVKIVRNHPKKFLGMCQVAYIKGVLERFQMHYSKPDIPVEKGLTFNLDQCPKTDQEKEKIKDVSYASAIGSLMYVMLCTRPDICFAVGLVSRYQSNPGPTHWQAVKRIMCCLHGTIDLVLCYQGGDLKLRGYSNAN